MGSFPSFVSSKRTKTRHAYPISSLPWKPNWSYYLDQSISSKTSTRKIIYWLKKKKEKAIRIPEKKKREAIFTNWRNEHRMPLNETNFASLICCKKQWDCPSWAGRCLLNCHSFFYFIIFFFNDPELLQNISAEIAKTENVKALTTTWTAEDSGFGRSLVMTAGGVDVISTGGKTTCMACSV